jgi:hypothetical protein
MIVTKNKLLENSNGIVLDLFLYMVFLSLFVTMT